MKKILKQDGNSTNVGDEGGFAPNLGSNEEAIEVVLQAIEKAGYVPGKHIFLGMDVASSEFHNREKGVYELKKSSEGVKTSAEMIAWYKEMIKKYPIITIEDGLGESDWDGWKELTRELGDEIQLVGDDLFVTNIDFLRKIRYNIFKNLMFDSIIIESILLM